MSDPPALLTPAGVRRVVDLAQLDELVRPCRVLVAPVGRGELALAVLQAIAMPRADSPVVVDAFGATPDAARRLAGRSGVGRLDAGDVRDAFGPPAYAVALIVASAIERRRHDVAALVAHAWACHVLEGGRMVAVLSDASPWRGDPHGQSLRALLDEASDEPGGHALPGGYVDGTAGRIVVLSRRLHACAVAPDQSTLREVRRCEP